MPYLSLARFILCDHVDITCVGWYLFSVLGKMELIRIDDAMWKLVVVLVGQLVCVVRVCMVGVIGGVCVVDRFGEVVRVVCFCGRQWGR